MRTELLDKCEIGTPHLESHSTVGISSERIPLKSLPFTIGRIETVDLQLDSTSISREHAEITATNGVYHLSDLSSTNGTFVNGEPIDDATLHDGDVVSFADTEFRFVFPSQWQAGSMVTQVLSDRETRSSRKSSTCDQIIAIRQMREALLHQAFDSELRPILHLDTNQVFGLSEVTDHAKNIAGLSRNGDLDLKQQVAVRFRQLIRATSLDHFLGLDQEGYLFLNVDSVELAFEAELRSHLAHLTNCVPPSVTLVVQFPATMAEAMAGQPALLATLDECGIELAYRDAVVSSQELLSFQETCPSFAVLSPNGISSLCQNRRKQRQLTKLVTKCADAGYQVISDGVMTSQHLECCREIGITLGLCDRPSPTQDLTARCEY